MWILLIILALGFIVGNAVILLRTANIPKRPDDPNSQQEKN
jgi:F0F1-type ATP synthase assembly protein I